MTLPNNQNYPKIWLLIGCSVTHPSHYSIWIGSANHKKNNALRIAHRFFKQTLH